MYRGKKKLTREQLVFVIDAIISGVCDRVEKRLPSSVGMQTFRTIAEMYNVGGYLSDDFFDNVIYPMIESASMSVSIIYAQLTDDSMEILVPCDMMEWEAIIRGWVKDNIRRNGRYDEGERLTPSFRINIENFVDEMFPDYLNK